MYQQDKINQRTTKFRDWKSQPELVLISPIVKFELHIQNHIGILFHFQGIIEHRGAKAVRQRCKVNIMNFKAINNVLHEKMVLEASLLARYVVLKIISPIRYSLASHHVACELNKKGNQY